VVEILYASLCVKGFNFFFVLSLLLIFKCYVLMHCYVECTSIFIFQELELYSGCVLPDKLVQFIFSRVPEGDKGDSRFIKIVAVRLWGSNYLASHTVSGSLNPKLAKKNPEKAKEDLRDSLDQERLNAVGSKQYASYCLISAGLHASSFENILANFPRFFRFLLVLFLRMLIIKKIFF